MDPAGFQELLIALQTPEPDAQKRAEQTYWELVKSRPSDTVAFLVEAVQNPRNAVLAKFAFILLFRLYQPLNEQFLSSVSAEVHQMVCSRLVSFFESPLVSTDTCPLLAFGVAAIAHAYLRNGGLQDFTAGMFRLVLEGDARVHACTLECLNYCIGYFGEDELPIDKEALMCVLRSVFREGESGVAVAAGIRLIFSVLNKKYLQQELLEFVPMILVMYERAMEDEKLLLTMLFDFYVCCHLSLGFLEPCIDEVLQLILRVFAHRGYNESVRRVAVDILSLVSKEYREHVAARLGEVCVVYMQAMSEINPEDAWDDETAFSATVSWSFGDLAELMDPSAFVECVVPLIQRLIKEPSWETSFAALRGLRKLVPACYSALEGSMDMIIQCLVEHFKHPHARARREAYDALTRYVQIADVAIAYREPVLKAVIEQISAEPELTVKAGAVCALSCLCLNLPKTLLEPLVDPIASSLMQLFGCGNPAIQAQVVRSLSSVALIAPESMTKFYPNWMAMTKQICTAPHDEGSICLICRIIESIAFLSRLVPGEVFGPDCAVIMGTWLSWKWEELPDDIFRQLMMTVEVLMDRARDLCLENREELIKKIAVLVITMEPTCVKYNAYEMGPQSLRADKLTFLTQANVYLEYDISELQKMCLTLEVVNKLMILCGAAHIKTFFPLRKRFVRFMQWDFYAPIQVAAVNCMATVVTREPEKVVLSQFSAFLRLRLTSNSVRMSPAAQKRFLEIWRKVILYEIKVGSISERNLPDLLSLFPVILNNIYQRGCDALADERLPVWQVEEPLAILAMDLYDKFTVPMLHRAFAIFKPIADAQSMNPGAFLVLTSCKHASFAHELPLQSALLAVTDGISDDSPEVTRIACNAMNMIVGPVQMEDEFVNEILCCVCMALDTHKGAKATCDSCLLLLTKLMQQFPQICLNPDSLSVWFNAMPITTESEASDLVYQFLVFLLSRQDLFPMTEEHFVKTVHVIASAVGTSLASASTLASLRQFLVAASQDSALASLLQTLDDATKAKLQAFCG